MTDPKEFTQAELDTLSQMFNATAEQNMSYGVCIKVGKHIIKWLTYQQARTALKNSKLRLIITVTDATVNFEIINQTGQIQKITNLQAPAKNGTYFYIWDGSAWELYHHEP